MSGPPPATDVTVPLADGRTLAAAVAAPSGGGPHPGVVVLHEISGLNADMRRIAGRFAAAGYVAAAPDLYSPGRRPLCLARVLLDGFRGADGKVMQHIEAARRLLADRPDVDEARIGVAGFCLGGGFALAFATRGLVGAAAVNYGSVPSRPEALRGVCPVVASYGALDRTMRKMPDRLRSHLAELGVAFDVKVYEGVGHSFLSYDNTPAWLDRLPLPDPSHAGYDEAAAEDAWARMLAFFAEHLPART